MMGTTSYYHFDGLGSTACLTDAAGSVTDRYEYSAYGEQLSATGDTPNPFRYVGQLGYYRDNATSDYYVRARNYQPRTARWGSEDPLGYADGTNLYQYVLGNPANRFDPSGLLSCEEKCKAIFAAQITFASGMIVPCILLCAKVCAPLGPLYQWCFIPCISQCFVAYGVSILKAKWIYDDCLENCKRDEPCPTPAPVIPDFF